MRRKLPKKTNTTQGRKKGGNLNSSVGKSGVPLRYHKPAAYKLLTQTYKDKLRDHQIALKVNTRVKGGVGKQKGSLKVNISSILKDTTAEEKVLNYVKP